MVWLTRSFCGLCIVFAMSNFSRDSLAQSRDTSLPAVSLKSGEAQLFVDDFLIATQSGLQRTLRMPKKDHGGNEPVIAIENEFGETKSTLEANGTILYDPKLKKWVMFTLAFSSSWPGQSADRVRMYRFTSHDAMTWTKGNDGQPQRIEIDLHDPQSNTSATNIDLFSCMYDEHDLQHPYKGWLFFANWGEGREGTYFVESSDGIQWKRGRQVLVAGSRTILQDGRTMNGTGDVTTFYYDEAERRFLGCLRWASATDVENTNRLRSRGFIFTDRPDRPIDLNQISELSLIPEAAERAGDMPTDEYYSSTAWRYGSLWLGGLRIWHSKDDYPYSASGCAFMKLVVSRDGLNWKKVPFRNELGQPEVFIPNGQEGANDGRNDGGYMTEFSNPPLRIGDELIWYYGCSSWGKNQPRAFRVSGGGIFRARLRPDGFVSIDRGSLVTRRLKFDGHQLYVNGIGPITVEVVSTVENNVTATATAHLRGDSLQHRVIFEKNRSLRDVAPEGIAQLRFSVGEGGALYSFVIQPDDESLTYRIQRTNEPIRVDGKLDEPAWKNARSVGEFQFPWWKEGRREQTDAKLLWNDQYLYVSFRCDDAHVSGSQSDRDSAVYKDDCVEVFTAPNPAQPNNYFNIEMNVRGSFLDQHHPGGVGTHAEPNWNATGVVIATSVDGTLNDDSDVDRGWVLEVAIPFENFRVVARNTPPKVGDVWHMNLNRLGGKTNLQHSQWSPGKSERPQFHAPQYFGRVIFGE